MSSTAGLAGQVEDCLRDAVGGGFRLDQPGGLASPAPGSHLTVAGGGVRYFLKLLPAAESERFAAEIDGLEALGRCAELRVPKVFARGCSDEHAWLVLEWLDLRPIGDESGATRAAEAIAALHAIEGEQFGWHRDNYIGATPQANAPSDNWARFFALRRLKPQFDLAAANGHGATLKGSVQRIVERLPALFLDHRPHPSLLHGDLWHGNLAVLPDGQPALFDPACHYGDRESDLAMSELFGGLPSSFYVAYRRSMPLSAEYEARKLAYTLYHILNHLNLFGRSYLREAHRLTEMLLRRLSA